ncbi:hypothetical protein GH714_001292 [Hevea brasiliensis]|uniref:Bulb-type lectin domain-containing protein n=1 Tax=Hevea brasiliensis TaxID=3981 RepID=A0A6A6M9V4_HEVBR|nr:hypothetical protein GH714_001292 [Hevea brasiliensis]
MDLKEENLMMLADWAYDCHKEGKVHLLVEDEEEATSDMKIVEICDGCNLMHSGDATLYDFFVLAGRGFNPESYSNISLGSSLTAQIDDTHWASPSGDFAFGFQQIENDGYLLAIWFNKVPKRTIVWSANRNNLVQSGSEVQPTTDGQLVLNDQSGRQIWNANSVAAGVSYAAILDTGNFVLANQNSVTFGKVLINQQTRYCPHRLWIQKGDLQPVWLCFPHRNMRITGDTGSGACGFNSYCRLGDDQRSKCQCPPGYTFLDPNDMSKGCKQNFVAQNCDRASQETDLFEFMEMPNTDWPLSDYEYFGSVNEDWCRQACLSGFYCAVAILEMKIVGRRKSLSQMVELMLAQKARP